MPPRARPHVTIVCATSLNGKLSTAARDPVRFTSRADRARLHALRDGADAILLGAATLRAEDPPLLPTAERRAARASRGLALDPIRAIVSRTLDLPVGRALERAREAPVHVFTTGQAGEAPARRLEDAGIHVHDLGSPLDYARVLETLAGLGVKRLVCEGGGEINAGLLEAGLVDDLALTLCPVVIGGSAAPTLVDGVGFAPDRFPHARLVRHELSPSGELFLDYQLVPGTSP